MHERRALVLFNSELHLKRSKKSQYFMFKWFYAQFSIHDMTKPYYPSTQSTVFLSRFYLCCMFAFAFFFLTLYHKTEKFNSNHACFFHIQQLNCNENIINISFSLPILICNKMLLILFYLRFLVSFRGKIRKFVFFKNVFFFFGNQQIVNY